MGSKIDVSCPMPKFDFEMITLGHGSGGLLTNKLLDSGVFDILKNDILDKRHDGAFLHMKGDIAFSTDSFVISPIFFPGGNIGELAVNGTVNDVAMCGAHPEYISLSFILEEGMLMTEFWEVLVGIRDACDKAGVKVVTGDTKVVDKGKGDKIFINTTGLGHLHPKAKIDINRIKTGDKIIVSNQIATHGIAILSVRQGLSFGTKIESDTTPLNHIIMELFDNFGTEIKLLRDPTRGGLSSTLNEIARDRNIGITLEEKTIPINKEVRAACEILGLDPLYTANEGVFIAVVSPEIADRVVAQLSKTKESQFACIIGEIVEEHMSKVVISNAMGGRRVVSMQVGEQLPRIC